MSHKTSPERQTLPGMEGKYLERNLQEIGSLALEGRDKSSNCYCDTPPPQFFPHPDKAWRNSDYVYLPVIIKTKRFSSILFYSKITSDVHTPLILSRYTRSFSGVG